jgi:hypothetical protein
MRELDLNRLVPATLIARRGFYALGRKSVFTNSYRDCHTVKAYRTGNAGDIEIKASIIKFLADNGYTGVSAHLTKRAIIIRIPK